MRKIIQIQACPQIQTTRAGTISKTHSVEDTIYALCDDGTLWQRIVSTNSHTWGIVKNVPQHELGDWCDYASNKGNAEVVYKEDDGV